MCIRDRFRRDWKAIAIFEATWALAVPSFVGYGPLEHAQFWFLAQGFRIHAAPVGDYLSKCKLVEFVEKGTRQTVGDCESSGLSYANVNYVVFYDTTGEIASPRTQRTPEWSDAISYYGARKALIEGQDRAEKLFGNFYRVTIDIGEYEG